MPTTQTTEEPTMTAAQRTIDIQRHHFTRVWARRHTATVHTFADGTVHDMAARRATVRACIRAQRATRAHAARMGEAVA